LWFVFLVINKLLLVVERIEHARKEFGREKKKWKIFVDLPKGFRVQRDPFDLVREKREERRMLQNYSDMYSFFKFR
jgi:hypothetical protein